MATVVNGVSFNLTNVNPAVVQTSFDKAQPTALTGKQLIKMSASAIKSNLQNKVTKLLSITSFDPLELKNKNHFLIVFQLGSPTANFLI